MAVLTFEHKRSLARAIRSFERGTRGFSDLLPELTREKLKDWATDLETRCDDERQREALKYIAYLPYTQPPWDDAPFEFALCLAALVIANGGLHFPRWDEMTRNSGALAQREIARLLR